MNKGTIDYKFAYMQHLFDKIKNKKTESYIIHRIWDKVDDERILFKTQQKVERPDGSYALIDLYLPQLNLFIEIDEPYHEFQRESDKQRNGDIVKMTHNEPIIISCGKEQDGAVKWLSLTEIHHQIDKCVNLIKQLIVEKEQNLEPWGCLSVDYHKEKGFLNVKKNDALSTIDEICELFDTKPKKRGFLRMGIADIPSNPDQEIWFPILKNDKNWVNELSEDKTVFFEYNKDLAKRKQHVSNLLKKHRQRVTFFKSKDVLGMEVFHFMGVFELDEEEKKKLADSAAAMKKALDGRVL